MERAGHGVHAEAPPQRRAGEDNWAGCAAPSHSTLFSLRISIMADDADFITVIVAAERVGQWLDAIREGGSLPRLRNAVRELVAALQMEAYAEEVA